MGCDIHMWLVGKTKEGMYRKVQFEQDGRVVHFPYFRHYITFGTLCDGTRSFGIGNNHPKRGRWESLDKIINAGNPPQYKDDDDYFINHKPTVHEYFDEGDKSYYHSHTWIELGEMEELIERSKNAGEDGKTVSEILKEILKFAKRMLYIDEHSSFNNYEYDRKKSLILIAFDS